MYRGRNKIAHGSQRQIADAMVALLQEKPYAGITVCELCRHSHVSRQTFYSLFDSKDDVICYALETSCVFEPSSCSVEGKDCCLHSISQAFSHYIHEQQEFLQLLVDNGIIYFMQESLMDSFLSCSRFCGGESESYRRYLADFLASGLTGIANEYILSGEQTTSEDLSSLIYRLFSGTYFH